MRGHSPQDYQPFRQASRPRRWRRQETAATSRAFLKYLMANRQVARSRQRLDRPQNERRFCCATMFPAMPSKPHSQTNHGQNSCSVLHNVGELTRVATRASRSFFCRPLQIRVSEKTLQNVSQVHLKRVCRRQRSRPTAKDRHGQPAGSGQSWLRNWRMTQAGCNLPSPRLDLTAGKGRSQ